MPTPKQPDSSHLPPELIEDFQRICRDELGKELSVEEAEERAKGVIQTLWLIFEIQERGKESNCWIDR
jgi:hypothetical protein